MFSLSYYHSYIFGFLWARPFGRGAGLSFVFIVFFCFCLLSIIVEIFLGVVFLSALSLQLCFASASSARVGVGGVVRAGFVWGLGGVPDGVVRERLPLPGRYSLFIIIFLYALQGRLLLFRRRSRLRGRRWRCFVLPALRRLRRLVWRRRVVQQRLLLRHRLRGGYLC